MSFSCSGPSARPHRPDAGHSRSRLPARGEHGFDRLACAAELGNGPLDLRLLAPQPADLLRELAERDPQLRRLAIAEIVKIQHLPDFLRSEEHTSELQSRVDLVCRLLL